VLQPGRWLLFGLLALAALFLVLAFDPSQGLAGVQGHRESLVALVETHPLTVAGGFLLLYAVSVALVQPWAAILSISAGAVFGLAVGTLLALLGATIGATGAFLGARYLLRDWVQRRFAARLSLVNEGIEREGSFYLFALRLVAWLPFFLINPLMGLTPMRLRTFFWVTLIGMLPVTAAWVNAGTQLGRVESVGQLVSPAVLLSLTLIGLLPLAAKHLVAWLRKRRS
jgi:uncharacterized membrane protein YdjX (TVP38/TMEM64 family)